ncbi:uncharacterized protein SPSK_01204 [Sporothrix schenckii 1099-18]|uniref:Methyltransferase domain-containing protein n=1 Tax=Sporothrix schenckii 1099-18 TaxID=1397361 RepID=A0A0F2LV15_SPOSC|nr:uncharacterized protein SPSK_01204 [Sporothrix schenckii 1099-18]KJR81308.1 hypothetical protein SPSK_01204 [Sporothrix schenckii 1099-18]
MSINANALDVWSTLAPEWDAGMGRDGNVFWQRLEKPVLERFLAEKKATKDGEAVRALDISTGNGLTARWLVSYLGGSGEYGGDIVAGEAHGPVDVTGTDGSDVMLSRARSWAADNADVTPQQRNIRFEKLDATQPDDFKPFYASPPTNKPFDVILMNMAIMDVPTLEPLAAALPHMLAVGGVFVGSLLHPVFITPRTRRHIELVDDYDDDGGDGRGAMTTRGVLRSVKLDRYLHVAPWRGYAWPNQSRAQFYFHRPLHELFGTFLKSGHLALDGIEEPAFTPEEVAADRTLGDKIESSKNFTEFPIFMYFRLRRIK